MITDKDVKKLLDAFIPIFPTKEELKQELDRFATREELEELKNGVYNKMDATYKEVINMRQEQAAHQLKHDDIQKDLDEFKSLPTIAHELKKL